MDLQMMYKEMYWASEGCLWEYIQRGCMNVDAMEKDFRRLLEFWKTVYLRKNREEDSVFGIAGDEAYKNVSGNSQPKNKTAFGEEADEGD